LCAHMWLRTLAHNTNNCMRVPPCNAIRNKSRCCRCANERTRTDGSEKRVETTFEKCRQKRRANNNTCVCVRSRMGRVRGVLTTSFLICPGNRSRQKFTPPRVRARYRVPEYATPHTYYTDL